MECTVKSHFLFLYPWSQLFHLSHLWFQPVDVSVRTHSLDKGTGFCCKQSNLSARRDETRRVESLHAVWGHEVESTALMSPSNNVLTSNRCYESQWGNTGSILESQITVTPTDQLLSCQRYGKNKERINTDCFFVQVNLTATSTQWLRCLWNNSHSNFHSLFCGFSDYRYDLSFLKPQSFYWTFLSIISDRRCFLLCSGLKPLNYLLCLVL